MPSIDFSAAVGTDQDIDRLEFEAEIADRPIARNMDLLIIALVETIGEPKDQPRRKAQPLPRFACSGWSRQLSQHPDALARRSVQVSAGHL